MIGSRSRRSAPAVLLLAVAACVRVSVSRGGDSAPAPTPVNVAELRVATPDSFLVTFQTTKGSFDVMARSRWAPVGADRFYHLTRLGYYDGVAFFRVVPNFVAQFGIHHDSVVNAAWNRRRIADDSVRQGNRRGTLSFARGGPQTRTVQLFINLRDNARLDTSGVIGFPAFAEVVRGMDVVDSLYKGYGDAARPGDTSSTSTRRGPNQARITREGYAYLKRDFPLLDYVVTARVVQEWRASSPVSGRDPRR
jgi:peptidyl-prolyl cis-trans isomerase A (cyclophilin A)